MKDGRNELRREERAIVADFGERYHQGQSRAALSVEKLVFGSDFGACGFTTVAQADELAARLGLGPGERLLDLGCGSGWPGLYIASETGCEVVSTDLPLPGLLRAHHRRRDEGLSGSSGCIQSTARRLPFARRSFHAVVHSDLLC